MCSWHLICLLNQNHHFVLVFIVSLVKVCASTLNTLIDDWGVGTIYKCWSLFMLHTSSATKLIRSQCTSAKEEKLPCLRKEKLVWQRVSQHFIPGDIVFAATPHLQHLLCCWKKNTRWVTILIVALLCNTVTQTLCMNIYCSIFCSLLELP